jgi:hypothetical protein
MASPITMTRRPWQIGSSGIAFLSCRSSYRRGCEIVGLTISSRMRLNLSPTSHQAKPAQIGIKMKAAMAKPRAHIRVSFSEMTLLSNLSMSVIARSIFTESAERSFGSLLRIEKSAWHRSGRLDRGPLVDPVQKFLDQLLAST